MARFARKMTKPEPPADFDPLGDEKPSALIGRLAVWGGVALGCLALAVFAMRSEAGARRIAQFSAPQQPVQVAARPVAQPDPMTLYEIRRLADAVRVLSMEREQVSERLAMIERTTGDITASITRQPPRTSEGPRAPEPRVVLAPTEAPPAEPRAEQTDGAVMRTEFGVDLAGDSSIEALQRRWQTLRVQLGAQLEGLRPVVSIQDGRAPGAVDLRLIAGPLSNAAAAARLCANLTQAGISCRPAPFDGQRLAIR